MSGICCISLVKVENFTGMVEGILEPIMADALGKNKEKSLEKT